MKTILSLAAGALLLGGIWWWRQPPSSSSIVKNMSFSEEKITYKGVDYQATWQKEPFSYTGDARAVLPEFNPFAPFNTHVVALTSGSYSDPALIEIKDGKLYLHSDTKALDKDMTGDLKVFQVVPRTTAIFKKLVNLPDNANVTFTGRAEEDGKITSDKGKYIQFGTLEKGRVLFLLTDIKINK